jgi:hypothetical protein
MNSQQMIATHPDARGRFNAALVDCIDACYACAQACTACADACMAESTVAQLRQCIRLNLDCADICHATGALASRCTGSNEDVLGMMIELCQLACAMCGTECERHAHMHEHCRVCADVCRACEEACRAAIQDFGARPEAGSAEHH